MRWTQVDVETHPELRTEVLEIGAKGCLVRVTSGGWDWQKDKGVVIAFVPGATLEDFGAEQPTEEIGASLDRIETDLKTIRTIVGQGGTA